jgi:DNA primase
MISDETRERIRAASDIVDVIGSYVPLKRAGANWVALCPFHKEKSPSFNVNPHRQIFHCFGCHKGGDVFTFVKEYESIDFMETLRRLADRAKIPLEQERGPGEQQARNVKEKLLQIHEQITQRWQNALANEADGQIAREYLAKRGVPAKAIELFRLGYAPDLWDDTVNWAKSKDHELAMVERAGLILRKEGSERYYDRFRGRLMFPICDEQGRVIGFSGRILTGDEKTAKYVNSPETPIFIKSKVFFGLDKSKRALLEAEYAVVCEGQLDLIACFMAGVENVVAPQGTAFTADQARILKRYVEEVVLCFDSDEAGQNATVRSLDSLLASGLAIRVATVPAPHDPDSYIKAFDGAAFRKVIENAEGFFDYFLNRLCATHEIQTDRGRLAVLGAMAEAVLKTGNSVLIDTYAQKTALRLGVRPEAVRAEFRKTRIAPTHLEEPEADAAKEISVLPAASAHEQVLLKLLFESDDHVDWVGRYLDPQWIDNPLVRQLVSERVKSQQAGVWQGLAEFLSRFETAQGLLTEVVMQPLVEDVDGTKMQRNKPLPRPEQQIADVALLLRNQYIDRQSAALMQRINQPDTADDERNELLRQRIELRSLKGKPISVRPE